MKTNSPALPSLSELQAYGVEPQWFGLGFIQLKVSDADRYHFWHPQLGGDLPPEEVHDHRYGFTSELLSGELRQELYAFVEADEGSHELFAVTCKEGDEEQLIGRGWLSHVASITMNRGSHYTLPAGAFHTIQTNDFAITHLTRDDQRNDHARVARRKGYEKVCPFARKIAVDDLWQYIFDCLHVASRPELTPALQKRFNKELLKEPFVPGYHLTNIPKGELGKPSKIVEEALELLDAYEQDSIIMEQVELSDLYGAIEAYMKERHPGLELEDVARFSDITKRAFANGRR